MNELMNAKLALYRTAPATLGLLKLDGVGPIVNRPSTIYTTLS